MTDQPAGVVVDHAQICTGADYHRDHGLVCVCSCPPCKKATRQVFGRLVKGRRSRILVL